MLTIMRILKSNKVYNRQIIRQWAVKCLATKQTNDKKNLRNSHTGARASSSLPKATDHDLDPAASTWEQGLRGFQVWFNEGN